MSQRVNTTQFKWTYLQEYTQAYIDINTLLLVNIDKHFIKSVLFRTITNFPDSPHRSENEDISHPGPSSAQESSKAETSYRPKKPKLSTFESAVLKYISNEQQTPSDDDEGDKQFLLSFLPVMKKLTMDKKMWARLKITEIMQQAVYNTSQPNSFQAPFPNQFLPQNMQYCIPNQQQFQSGFQYNNTPQFQTLTNISSTNSVKNNIQPDHELSAASPLSSVLSPSPSESTTSDVFSVIGQSMNMSDSRDYIH